MPHQIVRLLRGVELLLPELPCQLLILQVWLPKWHFGVTIALRKGVLSSTCIFRDLWQQRSDEEEIRERVDAVHLIVCIPRDDVVGAPSHDGQQEWCVIQY